MSQLVDCACELVCKAIEKYIAKENSALAKALKKAGYIDAKYTVDQAKELEDELAKILDDKTDKFINLLNDNSNASIQDVLDKFEKWNTKTSIVSDIETVFFEHFSSAIPQIANSYIVSIDNELTVETITNRTSAWIKSWSSQLADIMSVNTEDKLKRILSKGLEDGDSIVDVADKLLKNSALQNASRARTTALTEMLRANSVSAQEAYMQSPAVESKRWRHTGGYKNRPRENHIDMDKQTVAKEEPFELIGADGHIYYPMYPRDVILPPGESVNCHCIHQPIVNEDILGMSLEEREKMQSDSIAADNKKFKKEQKESGKSGKIKSNSSENKVDLSYIKSKKFKKKFENITDNKAVNESIYSQSKAFLTHRNGTDYEDMCLIDSKSGKIVGKQSNSHTDFYVDYNKSLNKAIDDSDEYSLIALHNHPTNNPPTGSDIVSAGSHKYKMGVVVTHDGRVFMYKSGNKPFRAETFGNTVDKKRATGYNVSEFEAITQALNDYVDSHGIEWSEL